LDSAEKDIKNIDIQFVQKCVTRRSKSVEDWSKTYCKQLAKLQTDISMQANQRPTSYGFRHTFIDEMKQLDISEHIVAQIVGHANPNITFSRYGKDINVAALLKDIERIEYQI
jgi:integrase